MLPEVKSPRGVFIYTSTNKVYGDRPNQLPLVELEKRWEIAPGNRFIKGIDESMSTDNTLHSIFGCSKLAADVLVQEYGKVLRPADRGLSWRLSDWTGP